MINFDNVTKENIKKHNLNYSYRILIIGGWGPEKQIHYLF